MSVTKNELREQGSAVRNPHSRTDWNLKELLERLDEDQEFLCELLRIFREDIQVNLRTAKDALREKNLPAVMRAAHTMKGMLRNLSMNRAAEISLILETAGREENTRQAEAALGQLEQAVAELLPEVNAQLTGVKA